MFTFLPLSVYRDAKKTKRGLVLKRTFVSCLVAMLGFGIALGQNPGLVRMRSQPISSQRAGVRAAPQSRQLAAQLGESPVIHVREGIDPRISLGEGRAVLSEVSGPDRLTSALKGGSAEPLSMAAGDIDEDGVTGLVCGYAYSGGGIVALYHGNPDAWFSPADIGSPSPFLSASQLLEIPARPDFLGIGDFDADGHVDIIAASRGSRSLMFLKGAGASQYLSAVQVPLPGAVTAMIAADLNRKDGLTDIAIAITAENGSRLLVFEGAAGAVRATPESFDLPAAASSLGQGQLDGDSLPDIAVGAGRTLLVIHGRDRAISLDETKRAAVASAKIDRYPLSYDARSIAVGSFSGEPQDQVAILDSGGAVHQFAWGKSGKALVEARVPVIGHSGNAGKVEANMFAARIGGSANDSLVRLNASQSTLNIDGINPASPGAGVFDIDGAPVAAASMRLNSDGMNDLVVLRSGHFEPVALRTQAAARFTVTSLADSGPGSLRQAFLDANASGKASAIIFSVPGTGFPIFAPLSQLPAIGVPVTIDGSTQPSSGFVVLDGRNAGTTANGLSLTGGNSLVTQLVISNFKGVIGAAGLTGGDAITLTGASGTTVEACSLGTDVTGRIAAGNGLGIAVNSKGNTIGGLANGTANLISGNAFRGLGLGSSASGNLIAGNFIGTDTTGVAALPNAGEGMFLTGAAGNTISRNLVSANQADGISLLDGASGNLISGNFVGTDLTGSHALGNRFGVDIISCANNTVGGTVLSARNIVSANTVGGVSIALEGATGNLVQGNLIGTDPAGTRALGNAGFGVFISASNNVVGGAVAGAGNLITATADTGVGSNNLGIEGSNTFGGNQVQGNFIGTDINGTVALGSTEFGLILDGSANNTIGGATLNLGNLISGHTFDGLDVANPGSTGNLVQNNFLGTDVTGTHAIPNQRFGLVVTAAPGNTIKGNLSSGNGLAGVAIGTLFQGVFGDSSTLLTGNFVGTDATHTAPLPNIGPGVFVENDSINNQIVDNIIGFNQGSGIRIPDDPSSDGVPRSPAIQIKMSGNMIFSNTSLGIDLGPTGPTPNAFNQLSGANRLQNFPSVTSAAFSTSAENKGFGPAAVPSITLAGVLTASPNTPYTMEFFFGTGCSGGQGHQFTGFIPSILGTGQVTTNATGNASYNFTFSLSGVAVANNGFVNGTATDPVGNTSELSLCAPVTGTAPAIPQITSASIDGKNLIVNGTSFDSGAIILLEGVPQRTIRDASNPNSITGKKVGKQISPGAQVHLQVQNSNGANSPVFSYTRPS